MSRQKPSSQNISNQLFILCAHKPLHFSSSSSSFPSFSSFSLFRQRVYPFDQKTLRSLTTSWILEINTTSLWVFSTTCCQRSHDLITVLCVNFVNFGHEEKLVDSSSFCLFIHVFTAKSFEVKRMEIFIFYFQVDTSEDQKTLLPEGAAEGLSAFRSKVTLQILKNSTLKWRISVLLRNYKLQTCSAAQNLGARI